MRVMFSPHLVNYCRSLPQSGPWPPRWSIPGENPAGVKTVLSFFLLIVTACAAQTRAPGDVRFALMGDTPYSEGEVGRLDRLIEDLNREDLAFVVHVGDITSGRGPCTDEWFGERKSQFAKIRHPFVLL